MTSSRVRITKTDNGYLGSLTIGCPDCGGVGDSGGDAIIQVGAMGDTRADALHKAALVAEHIASDPVMAEILPPQATAAIGATKRLASAAKRGSAAFRREWMRHRSAGVQRLARSLHDEAMRQEGLSDAEVAGWWSRVKKTARKAAKYGRKAASYGQQALNNPLVQAALPPQARAALVLAKKLAARAKKLQKKYGPEASAAKKLMRKAKKLMRKAAKALPPEEQHDMPPEEQHDMPPEEQHDMPEMPAEQQPEEQHDMPPEEQQPEAQPEDAEDDADNGEEGNES